MKKKATTNPVSNGVAPIYTIEALIENGKRVGIRRTCHGINAYELLGLLHMALNDVAAQIRHELPPPQRIYKESTVNHPKSKK